MKTEKWDKLNEIFHAALDMPKEERDRFLNESCEGDSELINEVEGLIQSAESEPAFLNENVIDNVENVVSSSNDLQGQSIGKYRIVKEVGRGGMGAVFLAERADKEFDQKVALKIVHNQFANEALLERFRSERQILASLKHPNIAHLIDGGTTEDGLPYFVMEYVEGETLLEYCDNNKLSTDDRLEIFQNICSAVSHAHKSLIIHRDIKPTNILVTKDGVPKLLDFGIAKPFSIDESEDNKTLTKTGGRMLTPDYASPEQISGKLVTTSTDVYSLGLVLYELLTGHHPYKFSINTPFEAMRMICEAEPTRPSLIVGTTSENKSGNLGTPNITPIIVSEKRSTQPEKLKWKLSGDIDNIILKCLRKEPGRRYETVNGFSLDIKRHIEGLPVSARSDTFGYRAGKFVKRNKFSVIAGVVVAASLVAETAITLVQNSRIVDQRNLAEKQKKQAEKEREKATRVSAFMVDLFRGEETLEEGREITAREILKNGSERVIRELKDEPEFQIALLQTMAYASKNIGFYDQALKMSRLALKICKEILGKHHKDTIRTLDIVGGIEFSLGNYVECERINKRIIKLSKKDHRESPAFAKCLNELGVVLNMQGKWKEAEIAFRKGIELTRKLLKAKDERLKIHTAETYFIWSKPDNEINYAFQNYNYSAFLAAIGKYRESEKQYIESLKIYRKNENKDQYGLAYVLNGLGYLQFSRGNFENGIAKVREALEIRQKAFGFEHSMVCYSMYVLGVCLYEKGDFDDARKVLSETLMLREKLSGWVHHHTPLILLFLGLMYRQTGEFQESAKHLQEAKELCSKIDSIRPTDSARIDIVLGSVLLELGEPEKAGQLIKKGFDVSLENLPSEHWQIYEANGELGLYYLSINNNATAKRLLQESCNKLKTTRGKDSTITKRIHNVLFRLL